MRPFRPLAALIAMTMLLTACASAKPIGRLDAALPEENRIRLGAVGVASPCLPPEVAYRVPAKGGWAGAGRGAGVAAMGSGEASMDAARSGGGGAEVGAAILLLSPLTALVGTIVGAACAEPAEKVDAAEAVLNEFTLYNDAAVSMNDYFIAESRRVAEVPVLELAATAEIPADYGYLSGTGIDTVAELTVSNIDLQGPWGVNPELQLVVGAKLGLVNAADGRTVYWKSMQYRGARREFCEWAADYACLLREGVDNACRELAECAAEEVFLLNEDTEYADPGETGFYGLKPISPEIDGEAGSLRPEFRWEPFPRPRDKAISGRVCGVTYDLRVWKAGAGNRAEELVYSAQGITGTSHEPKRPLPPSTDCVWSVRARYMLDGRPRTTLWGMTYREAYPVFYGQLPRTWHYPFSTPPK